MSREVLFGDLIGAGVVFNESQDGAGYKIVSTPYGIDQKQQLVAPTIGSGTILCCPSASGRCLGRPLFRSWSNMGRRYVDRRPGCSPRLFHRSTPNSTSGR